MSEKKSVPTILYVLRITLPLLVICSVTAAAVSLVYAFTYKKAEQNMDVLERSAISGIFGENIECTGENNLSGGSSVIYRISRSGEPVGYSVKTTVAGFGGDMEILIGYGNDLAIIGISVLSHSETPGLGDRIDGEYKNQYIGKKGELALGTDIDAIVGSTISSSALISAVNTATSELTATIGGTK